ncbi:MAG: rod shape-determining protein RodA [Verrucomicrobia bacterium]|nr:rod shape-determining protein RodA [Verrucomicrobiota bacterium]
MWKIKSLKWVDYRLVVLLTALMVISLLVISSTTSEDLEPNFFTPYVVKQLQFFGIGWALFLFFSVMDYQKLREWTWILYTLMILMLIGLFFVPSIQNVHRWYRIGGFTFQPSEYAKLIVVLAVSWFLDRKGERAGNWSSALQAIGIIFLPFVLILKQPDLGTSLVLFPIALILFYFGGIRKSVILFLSSVAFISSVFVSLFFLGVLDHESLRPHATKVLKDYQYERLNPNTYHQKAAQTAIALGGMSGTGWQKSEFTKRQWLPAAHTDSIFPAFAEEFGTLGAILLLGIFFGLIYVSFQVTVMAKDRFGRLLSAGISIYIAIHIVVNLGMMAGFLPITGVPLVMVSYGGSSILSTMTALGILQSIYSRRFTF